ncbi:hypothetical protein RSgd_1483 [Ralstonia solanacearum]
MVATVLWIVVTLNGGRRPPEIEQYQNKAACVKAASEINRSFTQMAWCIPLVQEGKRDVP